MLDYQNIYLLVNWGVIPFWMMLIIIPNHSVTNFFAQSIVAPLLLAGAYCFIAYKIILGGNILDSFELYAAKILYATIHRDPVLTLVILSNGIYPQHHDTTQT